MRGNGKFFYGFLALTLSLSFISLYPARVHANSYPPTPTAGFYGDADGDTAISTSDVNIIRSYILSQPYSFDTVQPQTAGQDWNTCDVSGDRLCSGLDAVQMNNYLLGKSSSGGGGAWFIGIVNLPASNNAPNTWTPFTINVYRDNASVGLSGAAGISVVAEIDAASAGTGLLMGRSCSPNPGPTGPRDQPAGGGSGAQCALAVTVTDWANAPGYGYTESGTYGFAVWSNGDGPLTLNFRVEANPVIGIPAVTTGISAGFSPECGDGLDNDGDTLTDYPSDPECFDPTDLSESQNGCRVDLLPGTGTVVSNCATITPKNVVWNGTDTFDFDLDYQSSETLYHLENASLRVTQADAVAMSATIVNQDIGTGAIGSNLPGVNPGIVYVGDVPNFGPETITLCSPGPLCVDSIKNHSIHPVCGSSNAHWTLTEPSANPYSIWLKAFANIFPTDLLSDPRYDPYTASIFLRTYNMDPLDSTWPAENLPTTSFAQGEWFYAHYYIDSPGDGSTFPFTSNATTGPSHMEDTGNLAAYGGGWNSTANYWYIGMLIPWSIRFDPATVAMNASDGSGGSGALKFSTATGTLLYTVDDVDQGAVDGFNVRNDPYTSSNSQAIFKGITSNRNVGYYFYPSPGNGLGGFANYDLDVGMVALHAIGAPGSGSPIKISYSSMTSIVAYLTNNTPYYSGDDVPAEIPRSANWPDWLELTPGAGFPGAGQYNAERGWICVQ